VSSSHQKTLKKHAFLQTDHRDKFPGEQDNRPDDRDKPPGDRDKNTSDRDVYPALVFRLLPFTNQNAR